MHLNVKGVKNEMRTGQLISIAPERIAQKPVYPRDSSRLLEITPDKLSDHGVLDLPDLLKPDDLLVLNDTRHTNAATRSSRECAHRGYIAQTQRK